MQLTQEKLDIYIKKMEVEESFEPHIDVIKNLTIEQFLLHEKAPFWATLFACDVLKSPFPEAEEIIAKSAICSYWYERFVLYEPFKKGENAIIKSPQVAFLHAKNILGKRWQEAEETIKKNEIYWKQYQKIFGEII